MCVCVCVCARALVCVYVCVASDVSGSYGTIRAVYRCKKRTGMRTGILRPYRYKVALYRLVPLNVTRSPSVLVQKQMIEKFQALRVRCVGLPFVPHKDPV